MAGEHTTTAIAEGLTMPLLGLGVWQAAEGAQTSRAVGWALFLTTKFRPGRRDPERELGASLQRLGVDQVDLYLVHWPQGGQRRSCCAGRSSETSRRFPNLSTASGSSRTPRCSTSRSTTTTWARWTPSTAPVAPAAPANAPGGSRLAQAVPAREMHSDGHRLH